MEREGGRAGLERRMVRGMWGSEGERWWKGMGGGGVRRRGRNTVSSSELLERMLRRREL